MGRKQMKSRDISTANDPVLRGSMAAMKRAALMARQIAIQTNTDLIIFRKGKVVRISADELRRETANVEE